MLFEQNFLKTIWNLFPIIFTYFIITRVIIISLEKYIFELFFFFIAFKKKDKTF